MTHLLFKNDKLHIQEACIEDIPFLLNWRNNLDYLFCGYPQEQLKKDEFITELLHEYNNEERVSNFIAFTKSNNLPFGSAWIHHLNQEKSTCFLTIYIEPNLRRGNLILLFLHRYLKYCFQELEINTILFNAIAKNNKMIRMARQLGIQNLGKFTLEGSEFFRFSISSNDFVQMERKYARFIQDKISE